MFRSAIGRSSPPDPRLARILWCGLIALAVLGIAAAAARSRFRADLVARVEPFRERALRSLQIADPFASVRAVEVRRFDRQFAASPRLTLLHVVPGAMFLALAPLQLSTWVRSRNIRFHRWSGRVLLCAGFLTGLTGLYFGLLRPYAGPTEALAIAVFGGVFLTGLGRAFVAIRRRQVSVHREWMLRAFAVAIGISTVRVVGAILDVTLTPAGVAPRDVFLLALWVGWGGTLAAAEAWIRYTR